MPLWIYTAGKHIVGSTVRIPMVQMFLMLIFLLIVPTSIGFLIKYKKPTVAQKIVKYIRPVALLVLLVIIAVGIYVKLYTIKLIAYSDWQLIVACAMLPAAAMLLCGTVTFLMRQPWKQIKTICIEVGVQNTALPLLILGASLDQPDADLSTVPPMLVAIATNSYLAVAGVFHFIHKKCKAKTLDSEESGNQSPVLGNGDIEKTRSQADDSGSQESNTGDILCQTKL